MRPKLVRQHVDGLTSVSARGRPVSAVLGLGVARQGRTRTECDQRRTSVHQIQRRNMKAIYDANVQQVAWFDGENLFDLSLNWIAFQNDGHVFSSSTLNWLGPLDDGSFQDRSGKVVAWLSDSQPSSSLRPLTPLRPLRPLNPLRPLRPLRPLKPLRPLNPLGGWSSSSWQQWLA